MWWGHAQGHVPHLAIEVRVVHDHGVGCLQVQPNSPSAYAQQEYEDPRRWAQLDPVMVSGLNRRESGSTQEYSQDKTGFIDSG